MRTRACEKRESGKQPLLYSGRSEGPRSEGMQDKTLPTNTAVPQFPGAPQWLAQRQADNSLKFRCPDCWKQQFQSAIVKPVYQCE